MNSFKDFGIKATNTNFTGDKIKMSKILNKPITVVAYKIDKSKFYENGNGKCLHLQIEIAGTKHVVFTGSATLMEMIEKAPKEKFPFETIIEEEEGSERYQFT